MSIRPVSVVRDYDLIWSGDSALNLPRRPAEPERLPDEASVALDERLKAWRQACEAVDKANSEAFSRAVESGDWKPILLDGDAPTIFRIRQIPGTAWRIFDRLAQGKAQREHTQMIFRLGVVDIIDGPLGHKLQLVEHRDADGKRTGLGMVVSAEDCDVIDRINPLIIDEIGLVIFSQRARA